MIAPSLPWSWSEFLIGDDDQDHAYEDPTATPRNLTIFGVWSFFVGLAVVGSASKLVRLNIGDLLVHPYLFPVAIVAPILLLTQIHRFPVKTLAAMLIFLATFVASTVSVSEPPMEIGELLRMIASITAIVVIALSIRSERDFVFGVLGLILAVGLMAFMSLQEDKDSVGAVRNALDTGNKNAYSLYALPAILVAGYVVVLLPKTTWLVKIPLIVSILLSLVVIFTSANRSGYVGAVLIAGMLFWQRKGLGLIIVLGLSIGLFYVMQNFTGTAVLDRRLEETRQGLKSDDLRKALIANAFELGVENPFLGISPQKLPWELGLRTVSEFDHRIIDSHNVFAYVIGGSGLICFAAFLYWGWSLWRIAPGAQRTKEMTSDFRSARNLMRMMLILYVIRGMFTREILYNPGFVISIGLTIGWCIVTKEASAKRISAPDEEWAY